MKKTKRLFQTSVVMIVLSILFFPLFSNVYASQEECETIAENFIRFLGVQRTIIRMEPVVQNWDTAGWIAHLSPSGYILLPEAMHLPPVKAYSANRNFSFNPKWFRDFLFEELFSGFTRNSSFRVVPANPARDFLLHYTGEETGKRYQADTILLTTKWNQIYPYNKKFPGIGGELPVTGCTQVAQAQIMNYWEYPEKGRGTAWHQYGDIEVSAVLSRKFYWNKMEDILTYQTPEPAQDAVALLLADLAAVNHTEYGTQGSAASLDMEAMVRYFGYSSQISRMDNSDDELFFSTLKNEIDNDRPVLLQFPGHYTVCDGYATDPTGKRFHVNMGWGGNHDDYYYLNETVVAGEHVYPTENLKIIYNILPCSEQAGDCYVNLEEGDTIEGSTISGSFWGALDSDTYEMYLKGDTTIGSIYQSYFIILSDHDGKQIAVAQGSEMISLDLIPGLYHIRVSLTCANSYYPYNPDYSAYSFSVSTQSLSQAEMDIIQAGLDHPPEINNDLEILGMGATHQIRVDARDAEGDEIVLSAVSDNDAVSLSVADEILTITKNQEDACAGITLTASAGGKETLKQFTVFTNEIAVGKDNILAGALESQDDIKTREVILEGECTLTPEPGFYIAVTDENDAPVYPFTNTGITDTFSAGIYHMKATMKNPDTGYYYTYEPGDGYAVKVSCPDAGDGLTQVQDILGMCKKEVYTISGTILDGSGNAIPDVRVEADTGEFVLTNTQGDYQMVVSEGFTGTLTPVHNDYTFTPASRTYSELGENMASQDYTGTFIEKEYTISGTILDGSGNAIPDVRVETGTGDFVLTNTQGDYQMVVSEGFSGTLTPVHNDYTFTPASRTYADIGENMASQDYTGTFIYSLWDLDKDQDVDLKDAIMAGQVLTGGSPEYLIWEGDSPLSSGDFIKILWMIAGM